ncbi:MAG: hypothetical protein HY645_08670 [Acidobacteria bacterium]|nr:hypothetical protein [Acidobacteriota bacterium]
MAFLLLVPILSHLLFSWMGFNPTDEGFTLAHSRRILDGQLPHRDFIIIRPFISPLIHVPFLIFGDYTYWASRFFVWFQLACIAWIWVSIIQRFLSYPFHPTARFCAALTAFAASTHSKNLTAWHTIDGLFVSAIGFALCLRQGRVSKLLGYFLIGTAMLCKQNFMFLAPLVLVILGEWRKVQFWLAAALPGVIYFTFLLFTGAVGDALVQMSSRTELLTVGIVNYFNRWFVLGVLSGYLSMWLAFGEPRLGVLRKTGMQNRVGIITLYAAPLLGTALSLGVNVFIYTSFGLFGMLIGILLYCSVESLEQTSGRLQASLLALVTAWSASVSDGYSSPALGAGPIMLLIFAYKPVTQRFLRSWLMIAAGAMLLSFGIARTQHIYRDQPAQNLTKALAGVFPGGRLIRTNPNTYKFLLDLNGALDAAKRNGKTFVIIPDLAGYWVQSTQPNPLPIVWPHGGELKNERVYSRVVAELEAGKNRRWIIVQKVMAADLRKGFIPIPNVQDYRLVQYVRSHFKRVDETRFFEIYRVPPSILWTPRKDSHRV